MEPVHSLYDCRGICGDFNRIFSELCLLATDCESVTPIPGLTPILEMAAISLAMGLNTSFRGGRLDRSGSVALVPRV